MIVSDNVMIAEGISHKACDIIRAIKKGENPRYKVWYAVTSAREPDNLMYILSSMEYRLPFYHRQACGELKLLGLAGSRQEALDIVLKITETGYHKDRIGDLKSYISDL